MTQGLAARAPPRWHVRPPEIASRGSARRHLHIRSAIDSLGHETFVLARPTRAWNIRPSHVVGGGLGDAWLCCFSEADRACYAALGIDSPRVQWGCHPELDAVEPNRSADEVRLFFPGGFMTSRKPLKRVLEASWRQAAGRASDSICTRPRPSGCR
jgi:hypothetical protein